jgi:hypothetical protein
MQQMPSISLPTGTKKLLQVVSRDGMKAILSKKIMVSLLLICFVFCSQFDWSYQSNFHLV